jgi:hypothetical protein
MVGLAPRLVGSVPRLEGCAPRQAGPARRLGGAARRRGEPAPRREEPGRRSPGRAHPLETLDVRWRVSGRPATGPDVRQPAGRPLVLPLGGGRHRASSPPAPLGGRRRAGRRATLALDGRLRADPTAPDLEPGGDPKPVRRPAARGRRVPKVTGRPGPVSALPAQPRGKPTAAVQAGPPAPNPAASAPSRWIRRRGRQAALAVPSRKVSGRATTVGERQGADRLLVPAGGARRVGRGEVRRRARVRAEESVTRTGSRRRRGRPPIPRRRPRGRPGGRRDRPTMGERWFGSTRR